VSSVFEQRIQTVVLSIWRGRRRNLEFDLVATSGESRNPHNGDTVHAKRRTLLSSFALSILCLSTVTVAQTKDVKIGYALAPTSHYGAGATAWGEATQKATKNAFTFKQFPSSALGGERELIEGLQLGTVEAAIVSTGTLSNFVPEVGVTDIPFLFRDSAHARAVLDGKVGQDILNKFDGRGLVALAWGEQGFRHITNGKKPINNPDDLKGLKIRTMENPVHITAFRALGAAPTPMAWPEVVGALQQGTIDGQENPLSVIVSAKLPQVQKHLALTGHVYSPAVLLVSAKFWNSLSAEQKGAFRQGAKDGGTAMRKYVDDVETKAVAELRAQGMQVTTLTDKSSFQRALSPAYQEYGAKFGKSLLDQISNTK
jgi:TRAP-type transport system periplasmic protein